MANDCIPYFEPSDRLTFQATAAVTGKRFIDLSADAQDGLNELTPDTATSADQGANIKCAPATAGANALGVAAFDVASGKKGTCILVGVVPVVADGAITFGDPIAVGTAGKAIVATTGDNVVGRALASCTDGQDAVVLLTNQGIL